MVGCKICCMDGVGEAMAAVESVSIALPTRVTVDTVYRS